MISTKVSTGRAPIRPTKQRSMSAGRTTATGLRAGAPAAAAPSDQAGAGRIGVGDPVGHGGDGPSTTGACT